MVDIVRLAPIYEPTDEGPYRLVDWALFRMPEMGRLYLVKPFDASTLVRAEPVAARGFRGEVYVDYYLVEGSREIGDLINVGGFRLRVVERIPWSAELRCVVDKPFSRLAVWRHRLFMFRMDVLYKLIQTGRIWGVVETMPISDFSVGKAWIKVFGHKFEWTVKGR